MTTEPSEPQGFAESATRAVAVGLDYDTDMPWVHYGDREKLVAEVEDMSGWFVRDVPAELVDRFEQAKRDLDAAIGAIHAAADFDAESARLRHMCDRYEGTSTTYDGRTFWDDCSRCGWIHGTHFDGSVAP